MKVLKTILLLLLIWIIPLEAQEREEPLNTDNPQSEEQPIADSGGIVVKGKSIRNIDSASTSTGVTADEMEQRSDKLLKDVLRQIPGMHVTVQRKGTTNFTMRGYDMSKVAILIDGIPMIDAFGGGMDIDNVGLLDVSEIIVTRGTCSALYGTRGSIGSINFIRAEPVEMRTTMFAEYYQPLNYLAGVSHGAPIGNFYYQISGLYDKANGYNISEKLTRSKREMWLLKLSRYDLYKWTLDDIYNNPSLCNAAYYLNDTGLWNHTCHEKYKINGRIGYHFTTDLKAGVTAFYNHTEMKSSNYFTDMRSWYSYNDLEKTKTWQDPWNSYIMRNISSRWPDYDDYAVSPFIEYAGNTVNLKANIYYYGQSNTFMAYADPAEKNLAYNRDVIDMTWSIWNSRTYGFNIYPSLEIASWNTMNFALSYYISDHREDEQAYNENSTTTIENYGRGPYQMLYIQAGYLTVAVEDEMRIGDRTELTLGISYDAQDLMEFKRKNGTPGNTDMVDQYQAMDDSMIWGTRDSFNPVAGVVYHAVPDLLKFRAAGSMKTSFPTLAAYTKTKSPYRQSADKDSVDVKIKPERMLNGNAGFEVSFIDGRLIFSTDYFYSRYFDKITRIYITKSDDYIYRNMDAAQIHGAEAILKSALKDVMNTADIDLSLTYTYVFARNLTNIDDSFINKGKRLEKTPAHKLTFDFATRFRTDTSLVIFGYLELNQIQYTMRSKPDTNADFSTSYFNAQELHNPLFLNIKLSQKFLKHYEVYIMCRNILDDYLADPFNPGPGRTFYVGGKAEF